MNAEAAGRKFGLYDTPNEEKKAFGARLREARELAGMTQIEAAQTMGYSQSVQLSLWEAGVRPVPLAVVVACAKLYGTTTDYLCGLASEPDRDPAVAAHREIAAAVTSELRRTLCATTAAAVAAVREVRPAAQRMEALARNVVEVGLTLARLRSAEPGFDDLRGGAMLARQFGELERLAEQELAELLREARRRRFREAADLVEQPVLHDLDVVRALQPLRTDALEQEHEDAHPNAC